MPNIEAPELRQEAFLEADRPQQRGAPRPHGGAPPGTSKRKPLIILTILVVVGLIVGVTAWLLTRDYQDTDDAFIDGHIIEVSPRISAEVVHVYIHDNEEVKKGQLLVELDPRDYEVALEKAQAQLLQSQTQVQQCQAQEQQAQAQLTQQSAQFDIASVNFNRDASLYQKDFRAVAKQDVDTTRASAEAARGTVDAAKAAVQAAQSQIGAAQAAVHVAQAAVDSAQLELSYTRISAAADGQITRKNVEPGDYVAAGQTLFSIVEHDVWVTANFKETQLTRMKVGQPVRIHVDAFPARYLKGHVNSFQDGSGARFGVLPPENATGNYVKVVQRIPIKILIDEPPDILSRLSPGMSVEPRVDIAAPGTP
ncbi:MAG TPA: HlyD family secretion protein [Chthoniobacteraceae bacterium]|jgi:membrane fusion protein (multidrug efflux system)|nr:HlyD family secretion protein [Chthoniobacteraceae bacterium]